MPSPAFNPGFRLSNFDVAVLAIGTAGALVAGMFTPWIGLLIAFVVAHFFLFCNVFRVSRRPELVWAGFFVLLAAGTIAANIPGWLLTFIVSLCFTVVIVALEMRKPAYHGVGWRRLNPRLPEWWSRHVAATDG